MQPGTEQFSSRPCPICNNIQVNILHTQRFASQFDGCLLEGYPVVVCKSCGFGFADQIPEQVILDHYYAQLSKYEKESTQNEDSIFDVERFASISTMVEKHTRNRQDHILDIGCATGGLLSSLKKRGLYNINGLDPSPGCARFAFDLYGIQVQVGPIWELEKSIRQFDFVILAGVLEHIRDVNRALKIIRAILAPEGRILIEVPDATRFAEFPDAPFQQFSVEHINFFSPVSLRNLVEINGFAMLEIQRVIRWQSAGNAMPQVLAVFKKVSVPPSFIKDQETLPGLEAYIRLSEKVDQTIKQGIDELVLEKTPLLVWGTGTHTLRLMVEGNLAQANIQGFVDSNPKYQGMTLEGIPVFAPSEICHHPEAILISSRVYQDEIERTIRQDLGMKNLIIKLYG